MSMTIVPPPDVLPEEDLTPGWRLAVARDPDDPRFVILTVRHELPFEQGVEFEAQTGELAQLAFLHTCIGFCAQAGVLSPAQVQWWFSKIAAQAETLKSGVEPSRIILPGAGD